MSDSRTRLVVVSNRVGPVRGAARAGGLVVGLVDVLRASGGIWCGWSGRLAPEPPEHSELAHADGMTTATVDLTEAEHAAYYNGFANRCLWPLFHFRIDLTAFERRYYDGYLRVNAKFARAFAPLIQSRDLIWVHDYHLIPLAQELRVMGLHQPMGFFLHIPFPPRDVLLTLPNADRLVQALFAYDVVGFQTRRDVERFMDYVVNEQQGRVRGDVVTLFGRSTVVKAFPIGIDVDNFAGFTDSPDARRQIERLNERLKGRQLIVGVDRLDYTKGLPGRFQAYETLLERYPETHGRLVYMQIAPPSRGEVPEYVAIRAELEGLEGHINGRFADVDWVPLTYINRAYGRRSLAGILRAADIGLVTPLRDGMNLVAKEYVAAQNPVDPGVLVLSRFAGAASQMPAALIVNPYDKIAVAEALQSARHMSREERRNRHAELMLGLRDCDVMRWRDDFMSTLERAAKIVAKAAGRGAASAASRKPAPIT